MQKFLLVSEYIFDSVYPMLILYRIFTFSLFLLFKVETIFGKLLFELTVRL